MIHSPLNDLVVREAKSLADYSFLRSLRNANRFFLTGSTKKISLYRQLRFWWKTPPEIYIYIFLWQGKRAGYLLLRQAKEGVYITEVLHEKFRGRGIGSEMIRFAKNIHSHLLADILPSNTTSIRLHEKSGFVRVDAGEYLLKYVFSGV